MPRLSIRFLRAGSIYLGCLGLLLGCETLSTNTPRAPYRAVSASNSSATASASEVGSFTTVNVKLKDEKGFGVPKLVPTITAVNTSGSSAGVSSGGCGTTDTTGATTCRIKANTKGTYTIKVTTPTAFTGGTFVVSQYARSLSFSTQPSCSGNCTSRTDFGTQPAVRVLDAVGDPVTDLTAYNVVLTLTTPGSAVMDAAGVSVSSKTVAANSTTGIATFAGVDIDIAGSYTLTATATDQVNSSSITVVSSSVTVVAGAAAKLGFTTEPSSTTATNVNFARQPIVAIQDASGNTVTSNNTCVVSLALTAPNVADVMLGTSQKQASSGLADFANNALRVSTVVGGTTYSLVASGTGGCSGLTDSSATSDFTITLSGLPHQLSVSRAPGNSPLNQVFTTQPIVQVLDVDGSLVSSDNATVVTIALTGGGGTLAGSTSMLVTNGVATFTDLKVTGAAGTMTYTLTGVNNGNSLISTTTSQVINTNGTTPAKLTFATQPTTSSLGASLNTVTVSVLDANGFLCFSDNTTSVTLSKNASSAAGALGGTLTATATNGVAEFNTLQVTGTAGNYFLDAASGGLTTGTSNVFAIRSFGTAAKLGFTTEPSSAAAAPANFTAQPVIAIQDASGNTIANDNATVVTLSCTNPSPCDLQGTLSRTAVNGVVTFSGLFFNAATANAVLTATSGSLTSAQSASFTVP